jgi:hypothetical protein
MIASFTGCVHFRSQPAAPPERVSLRSHAPSIAGLPEIVHE